MFGTLLVEARICLSTLESAYPVPQRLVREHRDILGAISRGDQQRTLELIDAHLRQAVKDLTELDR
jgi:DNA-binding GntR family transcriptional regulator